MSPFEAYKEFLAIKQHFSLPSYDYIKYNGSVRANKKSFESRNDSYYFEKLAKLPDLKHFLVANFIAHGTNIWVGDLTKDKKYDNTYMDWLKKQQSITYVFQQDIHKLDDGIDALLKTSGEYPPLLHNFLDGTVCVETVIIMDSILNFIDYWNQKIEDDIFYPEIAHSVKKYKTFIKFDKQNMKHIMKERWL